MILIQFRKLSLIHKIFLFSLLMTTVMAACSNKVHAATLNVSGSCTLADAVDSVNAGSDLASCGGINYGINDTINIPAGTQTLTADLNNLSVPVVIKGAGMTQTTIDGAGLYKVFTATSSGAVTFSDLKITGFNGTAINVLDKDVVFRNIEIDGTNLGTSSDVRGITVYEADPGSYTVIAENVYIHNISASVGYIFGFSVDSAEGTTVDVQMKNTTLADVHNSGGGINGIIMFSGTGNGNGGTLTANIINTTVHDITSSELAAPFAAFSSVTSSVVQNPSITMTINNITITGTRGMPGIGFTGGLETAAFYAAGLAANSGGEVNVDLTVSNSLMADNLSNGVSYNCSNGDLSPNVGGLGTVNTSIASAGYNISDDNSCVGFNQPGDQQNVSNVISTLGPLQNNGGNVPTRALLAGSPAIGAGAQVLGISTDARGVARTAESWDVGAFQTVLADSTTTPVSTSSGAGGTLADTGQGIEANVIIGIFIVSSALAVFITRQRFAILKK